MKAPRKLSHHFRVREYPLYSFDLIGAANVWVRQYLAAFVAVGSILNHTVADLPHDGQPVIARDHWPRHQIEMYDVIVAAGVLKIHRDVVGVVPFAAPSGVGQCCAVRTGAAVGLFSWCGFVAKRMCGAETALIPARIGAERLWHTIR